MGQTRVASCTHQRLVLCHTVRYRSCRHCPPMAVACLCLSRPWMQWQYFPEGSGMMRPSVHVRRKLTHAASPPDRTHPRTLQIECAHIECAHQLCTSYSLALALVRRSRRQCSDMLPASSEALKVAPPSYTRSYVPSSFKLSTRALRHAPPLLLLPVAAVPSQD